MSKIKLTDTMAQALKNAHKDPTGTLLVKGVGRGTRKALESRGLAWVERNGRCPLTPEGEAVRLSMLSEEHNQDDGRMTLEEALSEAHTEWQMNQPAVVRIAYVDGTTEECRNIPSGEIAAGIFAEACGNDRVAKAELVRGDGTVAAQWPLPDLPRATPRQGTCGRHGSRSVVMALRLTEHPACARGVGHQGLHRDTSALSSRKKTNQWGDNECLPLDSGR